MKTCPNCRVIYDDDYNGTCNECGKGLGSVSPNNGQNGTDLAFAFAKQIQRQHVEAGLTPGVIASTLQRANMSGRSGDLNGMPLDDRTIDIARSFVVTDEEKLREAGVNDGA